MVHSAVQHASLFFSLASALALCRIRQCESTFRGLLPHGPMSGMLWVHSVRITFDRCVACRRCHCHRWGI